MQISRYPLGPPPSLLHPESEPGDAAMVVRVGGGRGSPAVAPAQAGGQRPSQQVSALPLPPTNEPCSSLAWGLCQLDFLTPLSLSALKCTMGGGVTVSQLPRPLTLPNFIPVSEISNPDV